MSSAAYGEVLAVPARGEAAAEGLVVVVAVAAAEEQAVAQQQLVPLSLLPGIWALIQPSIGTFGTLRPLKTTPIGGNEMQQHEMSKGMALDARAHYVLEAVKLRSRPTLGNWIRC